jgi:lysophospholipase L1-like esterase
VRWKHNLHVIWLRDEDLGYCHRRFASAALFPELSFWRPEVVIIQAGINDLKLLGPRPDLRLKIVSTASENLSTLIKQCVDLRCKVLILLTWPPGKPELLRRLVWSATISDVLIISYASDPSTSSG